MTAITGNLLMVPALEEQPWPSLGGQVCAWIETNLVHGPGDLRGRPARLDAEKRAIIYCLYEVYPQTHAQAGRRRFKRAGLSVRKGWAKTELAAWLAAVELAPDGPVRCVSWGEDGQPVGGPVTDPYIPLLAYTETQSEELAYGALKVCLEQSPIRHLFDIGEKRVMRIGGDGKAEAIATAPSAADGARTTFQVFDETHRFTLPRHRTAHGTMLRNIPKRYAADAWSLETTTAPTPGEGSVAEATMDYAQAIAEGRITNPRLFYFHRQASDGHDMTTLEGIRAAVLEASGPVAEWSDVESIVAQWQEPDADPTYLERVWCNRKVQSAVRAFDAQLFAALARDTARPRPGAWIVLAFDGSRYDDSTALVATDIVTGFQYVVGKWEKPLGPAGIGWQVPTVEVNDAVAHAFKTWNVWRFYADPPYWEETVSNWRGQYGDERVIEWRTNNWPKMGYAVRAYRNAIIDGSVTHDGDAAFVRHVGNAFKRTISQRDDLGVPMFVITKERKDSPNKIDIVVTAVLCWQARCDALAEGIGRDPVGEPVVEILGGAVPREDDGAEAMGEEQLEEEGALW